METLISVIIPIYNMDIYLRRCLTSVVNQTYKNLEIVLVDDGSTDNTPVICKQFADKDSRINVLRKKNGGVSAARNYGFDNSKGSYVCFIDADDFVSEDYVETLYKMCEDYGCDIAQCRFEKTNGSTFLRFNKKETVDIYCGIEMIENIYNDLYVQSVVAFNKLYKREVFGIVRYPEGLIHEDEATTPLLFYNASRIAVTNKPMYYYYSNEFSITRSAYSPKQLDAIDAVAIRARFFKEKNLKHFWQEDCYIYLSKILLQYYKAGKYLAEEGEKVKKQLKSRFLAEYEAMDRKGWSIPRRILMCVCRHFPYFYAGIYLKIKEKISFSKKDI